VKGPNSFVVVDGKEGAPYPRILLGSLIFSPDGEHFVYTAYKGQKKVIVFDNVEGPECDIIPRKGEVFSPDSEHFMYSAVVGQKWMTVIDGIAGPEYDNVMTIPADQHPFNAAGDVEYLAQDNGILYRVRQRGKAAN